MSMSVSLDLSICNARRKWERDMWYDCPRITRKFQVPKFRCLIFFLKEVKAEAATSLSALSTLKVPFFQNCRFRFTSWMTFDFCWTQVCTKGLKRSLWTSSRIPRSIFSWNTSTDSTVQIRTDVRRLPGKCGMSGFSNSTPRCSTWYH